MGAEDWGCKHVGSEGEKWGALGQFDQLGLCRVYLHRVCQAPQERREKQEMWALW